MATLWYVAAGSAAGGVARYLVSTLVQQRAATPFPVGTLVVNVTGSLAIGILLRYALATPEVTPELRALLATGFCGGYTTFSAFSHETAALLGQGDYRRAAAYVVVSVLASLAATLAGIALAEQAIAHRR